MEGKEVRFGIFNSALFATITTDASCGAVNSMHDSFTPLGGLVPLFNMQTGRSHLRRRRRGTLRHAGLRRARGLHRRADGRPHAGISRQEDRGLRCEDGDALAAGARLSILGFTAWARVSEWGQAGLNNAGPHGFSEILYAYSSATGNNGSAFAGLTATRERATCYNTTLGLAMLIGRFLMIVPILALAGSLVRRKLVPAERRHLPGIRTVYLRRSAHRHRPARRRAELPARLWPLGPIVEHFLMGAGKSVLNAHSTRHRLP